MGLPGESDHLWVPTPRGVAIPQADAISGQAGVSGHLRDDRSVEPDERDVVFPELHPADNAEPMAYETGREQRRRGNPIVAGMRRIEGDTVNIT